MQKVIKIGIAAILCLSAIIAVLSLPPMAQDEAYHNFADTRTMFRVHYFCDVVSNFLFILFGIMGLQYLQGGRKVFLGIPSPVEWWLWVIFFLGAILIGLGSGYYHLNPNNNTLVWDRLPMTISFMSLFSIVISERFGAKLGVLLAPLLLTIGIGSVLFWDYTESLGKGDLRPYILVQFLPLIIIPLILWLFPNPVQGLRYLCYTLCWYVLAKVFEHFDNVIFSLTYNIVSGHTLKHLAAAMGVYSMLLYVNAKRIYIHRYNV